MHCRVDLIGLLSPQNVPARFTRKSIDVSEQLVKVVIAYEAVNMR